MKIFVSKVWPFFTRAGTPSFCTEMSLPRVMPSGSTSSVTPNRRAASTACIASPMFSLPSESSTRRFCPVSGKAAEPRRSALAMSVRSVGTTARTLVSLVSILSLAVVSIAGSVPNTSRPERSSFFFSPANLLTILRAASCCGDGMESERSSRKNTFTPSSGFIHCTPAMASTSSSATTKRRPAAIHRRQAPMCTSDFSASQRIHAHTTGSRSSH